MLNRYSKTIPVITQCLDILTLIFSFIFSGFLLANFFNFSHLNFSEFISDFSLPFAVISVLWWLLFKMQNGYKAQQFDSFGTILFQIIRAFAAGTVFFLALIYFLDVSYIPRKIFLSFLLISFLFLFIQKYTWFQYVSYLKKTGRNKTSVLIVGATLIAKRFIESVQKNSDWGLNIIGFIDRDKGKTGQQYYGAPVLGDYHSLLDILHQHFIEEVIFAVYSKDLREIRDLFAVCETEGVQIRIISNFFSSMIGKAEADVFHDIPIITYNMAPHKDWQVFIKRIFDLFFSGVLLLLLSPLFILISGLVKFSSPGPVFYYSKILGKNKKPITTYKFRTMYNNADEWKEKLVPQNELNGPVFKMKNDPRVTNVGRVLRKYSLDELPQLFSVIKGDMSLVGPRPPLQSELPRFENWHRRKLSIKPGMTGLWQVSGRNKIKNFDDWVRLDLRYIDHWSLWLDFKILIQTIPVVLKGTGF